MTKSILKRRGYTLVDLIAVAACIAFLSAVLLPAILHARSQARSNQCRNRLQRIGLGLHNYVNTFNCFPPGWVSGYRDSDSQAAFGWMSKILPFVDQGTLFNRLNQEQPMAEPDALLSMAVEAFQCPGDANVPPTNLFRGGYGRSSYSGNMGDMAPIRWSDGRVEAYWPGGVPTFHCAKQAVSPRRGDGQTTPSNATDTLSYTINGVFGWNSNIRFSDIVDGTSNTLAVGERSRISGWSIWPGVGSNRFENDSLTDVSFESALNKSLTGFSSPHEGGLHVGMIDGSVRFLGNGVDSRPTGGILQHLGNRMDQQVIPPNVFSEF